MCHRAAAQCPAGVLVGIRKVQGDCFDSQQSPCASNALGHPCRESKQMRVMDCEEDRPQMCAALYGHEGELYTTLHAEKAAVPHQ